MSEEQNDLSVTEIIEEQNVVEEQEKTDKSSIGVGTHFTLAGIVFKVRKIIPRKNEIVCRVVGTVPEEQSTKDE